MAKGRTGLIAALDVGSTKVSCFIAHAHSDGAIRVAGIGHHVSKGVRGGAVVDMESAQNSILAAVSAAEELAGERIREVVVNVAGGELASRNYVMEVPIGGHEIADADMHRILTHANGYSLPADHQLLHRIPVGFSVDATRNVRDPRGLFAEKLSVDMHVVSARTGVLRNLTTCIERCHLDIESVVAAPYASGLACLVEDEIDLGVTVVDMGGGTTSIAVFSGGEIMHTETIPIGGNHVTSDVARGLSTPLAHAERMKTLYGSAIPSPADEREVIDVPLVGEEASQTQANHVPRSILNGIIRPRVEETFEMVRNRLDDAGMDRISGRRLVLTGGASQLQGARELAALVLEKQVRVGRPLRVSGLAEATSGPAFSTCAGLLRFAVSKHGAVREEAERVPGVPPSRMGRITQWLRENF